MYTNSHWFAWTCLLAVFCLLLIPLPPVTAASLPQSESQSQDHALYFPFIAIDCPQSARLLSPANGAVLDTLLPVFQWDTSKQPTGVKGCLSLSTQPDSPSCNIHTYTIVSSHSQRAFMVQENLLPGTVYYWRVGIVTQHTEPACRWSQEWSFTTAPAGGELPPGPQLTAPANHSTLPPEDLVLSWKRISGAAGYFVHWSSVDGHTTNCVFFSAGTTNYTIPGVNLTPGYRYEWWVKARSAYGYGPASESWTFLIRAD